MVQLRLQRSQLTLLLLRNLRPVHLLDILPIIFLFLISLTNHFLGVLYRFVSFNFIVKVTRIGWLKFETGEVVLFNL